MGNIIDFVLAAGIAGISTLSSCMAYSPAFSFTRICRRNSIWYYQISVHSPFQGFAWKI